MRRVQNSGRISMGDRTNTGSKDVREENRAPELGGRGDRTGGSQTLIMKIGQKPHEPKSWTNVIILVSTH